jgi:hypothetical protein
VISRPARAHISRPYEPITSRTNRTTSEWVTPSSQVAKTRSRLLPSRRVLRRLYRGEEQRRGIKYEKRGQHELRDPFAPPAPQLDGGPAGVRLCHRHYPLRLAGPDYRQRALDHLVIPEGGGRFHRAPGPGPVEHAPVLSREPDRRVDLGMVGDLAR